MGHRATGYGRRAAARLLRGALAVALVATAGTAAEAPLADLSREAWRAKPADASLLRRHTAIKGVVIHYSGYPTKPKRELAVKLRNLQYFSQVEKGWGDVPYHFYIGVKGGVAEGRSLDFAGDSNTRYAIDGWIQIVLEGDFDQEEPSRAQLSALVDLVRKLRERYGFPATAVTAHKDHAPTLCPGENLMKRMDDVRAASGPALGPSGGGPAPR